MKKKLHLYFYVYERVKYSLVERYDFSEICVLNMNIYTYALVEKYDFSETRKYVCTSFTSMITTTSISP